MKLEQACKFRTDQYRVCSRSEGFTEKYDAIFNNVLHDAMNCMFLQPGQSVLSLTREKGNGYLSMSTMRSDMYGRPSLFSNAYLIPDADFQELICNQSAALLAAPVDSMMTEFDGRAEIPAAELKLASENAMQLQELRERCGLTDERYTRLLLLSYRSICEGRSLCVYTRQSMLDAMTLVRELAFCILSALPAVMRRQFSFSSGPDTRMRLCIHSADCGKPVGNSDLRFDLDDERLPYLESRDHRTMQMIDALVQADETERRSLLDGIDRFLRGMGCEFGYVPKALPTIAYYIYTGQTVKKEECVWLLDMLLLLELRMNPDMAFINSVLTALAKRLVELNYCPPVTVNRLIERSYRIPTAELDACTLALVQQLTAEECIELVAEQLKLTYSDRVCKTVCALLDRVPCDVEALGESLTSEILQWTLDNDVEELAKYCVELLSDCSIEKQKYQLELLLNSVSKTVISRSDAMLLTGILTLLSQSNDSAACLSEEACAILDQCYVRCAETCEIAACQILRKQSLWYLISIRLHPAHKSRERSATINRLHSICPQLEEQLWKVADDYNNQLWKELPVGSLTNARSALEQYLADYCVNEAEEYLTIQQLCRHNYFKQADGDLEKAVCRRMLDLLIKYLDIHRRQMHAPQLCIQQTKTALDYLDKLGLSLDSKKLLKDQMLSACWSTLSFKMLILDTPKERLPVPYGDSNASMLERILEAIIALRENNDAAILCKMLRNASLPEEQWNNICAQMLPLQGQFLKREEDRQFFFDLLILSCSKPVKGKLTVDKKQLMETFETLENDPYVKSRIGGKKIRFRNSVLLLDRSLCSKLKGTKTRNAPFLSEKFHEICEQAAKNSKNAAKRILHDGNVEEAKRNNRDDGDKKSRKKQEGLYLGRDHERNAEPYERTEMYPRIEEDVDAQEETVRPVGFQPMEDDGGAFSSGKGVSEPEESVEPEFSGTRKAPQNDSFMIVPGGYNGSVQTVRPERAKRNDDVSDDQFTVKPGGYSAEEEDLFSARSRGSRGKTAEKSEAWRESESEKTESEKKRPFWSIIGKDRKDRR